MSTFLLLLSILSYVNTIYCYILNVFHGKNESLSASYPFHLHMRFAETILRQSGVQIPWQIGERRQRVLVDAGVAAAAAHIVVRVVIVIVIIVDRIIQPAGSHHIGRLRAHWSRARLGRVREREPGREDDAIVANQRDRHLFRLPHLFGGRKSLH